MKSTIISRIEISGYHTLYLVSGNREYYLFRQEYRKGVADYFKNGVLLQDAINISKVKNNTAVIRTMSKLLSHIRYVEKESGIAVLDRTIRTAGCRNKSA